MKSEISNFVKNARLTELMEVMEILAKLTFEEKNKFTQIVMR